MNSLNVKLVKFILTLLMVGVVFYGVANVLNKVLETTKDMNNYLDQIQNELTIK